MPSGTSATRLTPAASQTDEDAPKRQQVLRGERAFLLDKLLRSDRAAYLELIPLLLEQRGMTEADLPRVMGVALTTEETIELGLAQEARALEAQAERRAAKAAAEAAVDAEGAIEEARREALAAEAVDADGISALFSRAFLASEEAHFKIEPKVVGYKAWSDTQERTRIASVRALLTSSTRASRYETRSTRSAARISGV